MIGTKEILQAREVIQNAGDSMRIEAFDEEYAASGMGPEMRKSLIDKNLAYEDGDFIYAGQQ